MEGHSAITGVLQKCMLSKQNKISLGSEHKASTHAKLLMIVLSQGI